MTNIEPIVISKLEEVASDLNQKEEVTSTVSKKTDASSEVYKRMGLTDLKKLVISKGLSSDPSKLKKPELIKLLLENE